MTTTGFNITVSCRSTRGFSLAEVALALGIAAFCLISMFGLLPVGVSSNQTSLEQTAAASVAANVVADLRAAPLPAASTTTPTSPQFGIQVPSAGGTTTLATIYVREDGTEAIASGTDPKSSVNTNASAAQNPRYRVTVTVKPPATAGQRGATTVRILVTWPALADPTASVTPTKYSGVFESFTALDRN